MLKNNQGKVNPKNVHMLKYPFPGTVKNSACSLSKVPKNPLKPPKPYIRSNTTIVDETIIKIACKESVHTTD